MAESGAGDPVGAMFSGFVRFDKDTNIIPDLAECWEVSADGTIFTFYLRKNARFHDGRAVAAQDVRYLWERACAPNTKSPHVLTYLGDIVGASEMMAGKSKELGGAKVMGQRFTSSRKPREGY